MHRDNIVDNMMMRQHLYIGILMLIKQLDLNNMIMIHVTHHGIIRMAMISMSHVNGVTIQRKYGHLPPMRAAVSAQSRLIDAVYLGMIQLIVVFGVRAGSFCHDDKDRCWFETEGICGGNTCMSDGHCDPIFARKYDYVGKGFIEGMNGAGAVYSRFTKEISHLLPIGMSYILYMSSEYHHI